MERQHREAISKSLKGHKVSEETKRKIGLANRGIWVKFRCDNCKKENEEKQSHYKKSKRHYCNRKCQKEHAKTLPFYEQNAYRGIRKIGENKQEYHRRYVKSHKERIAHLKARRYARERNADGQHSFEEWQEICRKSNWKCAKCRKRKKLTKDHIKPLSFGGTDYISNIQPLCRSCNSRKWKKLIYETPELLKGQKTNKIKK